MSFNVGYSAGGVLDEVKRIKAILGGTLDDVKIVELIESINKIDHILKLDEVTTVKRVDEIGYITGFPELTQPYNTMVKINIPAIVGEYVAEYETPDEPTETLALTVTCSGYGEEDKYDLLVNDQVWFDNWYLSEVREGLFLGSATFVYKTPPKSKMKLIFKNESGTSKTLWFGIRMLRA